MNTPDENPSSLGAFEFPVRFPGQYADKETNGAYNLLRDCYDASTGRYCQADPIGLQGGVNVYAYGNSSPIQYADPYGLSPLLVEVIVGGVAVYIGYNAAEPLIEKAVSLASLLRSPPDAERLKRLYDAAAIGCLRYKDEAACGRMRAYEEEYRRCTVGGAVSSGANLSNTPSGGLPSKVVGSGVEIVKMPRP